MRINCFVENIDNRNDKIQKDSNNSISKNGNNSY